MNWTHVRNAAVRVNNVVMLVLFRIGEGVVALRSLPLYVVLLIASFLVPMLGMFLLSCLFTWALNRTRVAPRWTS